MRVIHALTNKKSTLLDTEPATTPKNNTVTMGAYHFAQK